MNILISIFRRKYGSATSSTRNARLRDNVTKDVSAESDFKYSCSNELSVCKQTLFLHEQANFATYSLGRDPNRTQVAQRAVMAADWYEVSTKIASSEGERG